MGLASRTQSALVRIGELTYLAASVEASLYRNGKVFTRRDGSGNDSPWQGADLARRRMPIHDARDLAGDQRRSSAGGSAMTMPASAALAWSAWAMRGVGVAAAMAR